MTKYVGLSRTEKKNGNKEDLYGTHSITEINNSQKTE